VGDYTAIQKQMLCEHKSFVAWFLSYDLLLIKTKCSKCPPGPSVQDVACLNKDCDTGSKMSDVLQIISDLLCIHCCKFWTSLTSVVLTFHQGWNSNGLISGEWVGHPVISIIPGTYWRIQKLQENGAEHIHVETIYDSSSLDPQLAIALEGCFVANYGQQHY
jgi:hypothetical protein